MAHPSIAASSGTSLDLTGERTPIRALIGEMRRRRTLLPMLANRDFRAKYRSTSLGLVWAILMPLIQGTILSVVFTHIVRIQTHTSSYPVFVLAGMTTWSYISTTLQSATTSIVDQADIAGRVYFPRLFLPGMVVLANAPGLLAGLVAIIPISVILGVTPTWHLIALPLAWLLAVGTVYSVGAPLAVLNVYFRDVKYFVLASLQALLYASPIIYPLSLRGRAKVILYLNPATGIIELVRWSYHANGTDGLLLPLVSTVSWCVVLTVVALMAYAKHERLACDRL